MKKSPRKKKHFQDGDMVLLYDKKFAKDPGNIQMHWLDPNVIQFITDGGVVQLLRLDGVIFPKLVNGSRLNPYRSSQVQHLH